MIDRFDVAVLLGALMIVIGAASLAAYLGWIVAGSLLISIAVLSAWAHGGDNDK